MSRPPTPSIVADPRTAERVFDTAVAVLDDVGGNGADEGVERVVADRVDDAFAGWFRAVKRRFRGVFGGLKLP